MVESHPSIEIKDTSFGYTKKGKVVEVMTDLSLKLFPGELLGLAGINGAGKSTFLRTIAGLLTPLRGEILLHGKSISNFSPEQLSKEIALVLTEKLGGFNLKVRDLVAMGQMPYTDAFHRIRESHAKRIDEAISSMGIDAIASVELTELSDGMFQKAIIAKALAQQTQILLMDEPTAYLDYASKHQLFGLLKNLCARENKCIIVSSHDLDLLINYCDKILLFSDGKAELLPVAEVRENRNFRILSGGFL